MISVPYIEAMASDTAVITSHNLGAQDLFGARGPGCTVDDQEFGCALVEALAGSAKRKRMERAGRERSAEFDWQEVASRYERVYEMARQKVSGGAVR